jgi:hypothetical protein
VRVLLGLVIAAVALIVIGAVIKSLFLLLILGVLVGIVALIVAAYRRVSNGSRRP